VQAGVCAGVGQQAADPKAQAEFAVGWRTGKLSLTMVGRWIRTFRGMLWAVLMACFQPGPAAAQCVLDTPYTNRLGQV